MTMPGRAVWMLTSTSLASLRIVMSDRPACASLRVDVVPDLDVLGQVVGEVPLGEPVGLPVVDVTHAHRLGMNLLTHAGLLLRRERDREVARALADARRAAHGARAEALEGRALVGETPSGSAGRRRPARGCARRSRPPTRAASPSRERRRAACRRGSPEPRATDLPRRWSHTSRALRADVRTYLRLARGRPGRSAVARARRGGPSPAGSALTARGVRGFVAASAPAARPRASSSAWPPRRRPPRPGSAALPRRRGSSRRRRLGSGLSPRSRSTASASAPSASGGRSVPRLAASPSSSGLAHRR